MENNPFLKDSESFFQEMEEFGKSNFIIARDKFYEHLIFQEIPFWINKNKLIDEEEISYLSERRGFNEFEIQNLKQIANIINKHKVIIDKEDIESIEFATNIYEYNNCFFNRDQETLIKAFILINKSFEKEIINYEGDINNIFMFTLKSLIEKEIQNECTECKGEI